MKNYIELPEPSIPDDGPSLPYSMTPGGFWLGFDGPFITMFFSYSHRVEEAVDTYRSGLLTVEVAANSKRIISLVIDISTLIAKDSSGGIGASDIAQFDQTVSEDMSRLKGDIAQNIGSRLHYEFVEAGLRPTTSSTAPVWMLDKLAELRGSRSSNP